MARQLHRLCSHGIRLLKQSQASPLLTASEPTLLANHRLYSSTSKSNIPVPNNVEEISAGEKAQFSRQRHRDITGPVLQPSGGNFGPGFMSGALDKSPDAHVGSYDCQGAVSLHSVMQTNVPEPFSATGKAPTHLNMPGGQWSQEDKYVAQDMQDAHAAANTPLPLENPDKGKAETGETSKPNPASVSKKEQLKRAVKEYGATVIVFHVAISLMSLGGCYLAVSSGLDVPVLLEKLGWGGYTAAAAGASTFVVAYAVHKVFAPVRISITLGATPFIVRYLRKKGILKPPKTNVR